MRRLRFWQILVWVLGATACTLMLMALTGCAHINQTAKSVSLDPKTGVVATNEATISVTSFGGSKQIVEKLRASGGKTASVGASGMEQESTLKDLIELIKSVAEIASKPVVPVP